MGPWGDGIYQVDVEVVFGSNILRSERASSTGYCHSQSSGGCETAKRTGRLEIALQQEFERNLHLTSWI